MLSKILNAPHEAIGRFVSCVGRKGYVDLRTPKLYFKTTQSGKTNCMIPARNGHEVIIVPVRES